MYSLRCVNVSSMKIKFITNVRNKKILKIRVADDI